ncbi:MAG: STAS domain-containing protein, partial [Oscillospiraceae bacterium]
FKDVTFMDSSGIGLIMGRYKLMKSFDGDVFIANCSFQMKKVMKLAGLDKLAEFI